jgi:predicted signal transduction protein with EAL and GGDEF domain
MGARPAASAEFYANGDHDRGYAPYLFAQLDREIAFANRHGTPLSLVMIDLDHFKKMYAFTGLVRA